MTLFRGYRYRLDPTPEQTERLAQIAGVCRLVYNLALEQRTVFWRQFKENTGKHISFPSQSLELTGLRAAVDWIAAEFRTPQEQALRDLDSAFAAFFSGRARYPQPRRKGIDDSFRFKGIEARSRRISDKWSAVHVPKVGWVRFRDTRALAGTVKNVTFVAAGGRWFVSFICEVECPAEPSMMPIVGIDRGVAQTLTLSTGEAFTVPASLKAIELRQRLAKRRLSRKVRGSARYAKQRRRVAAMASRCARIRKDWHHRVTTNIARRFGTVVMEDLTVVNMTASGPRKRGLNRSILNQGWGAIERMLAYKLAYRGGTLTKVSAAYTSQCCSECGTIDKANRQSQAVFKCVHCGHEANADTNAAINIERRGSTPSLCVEAQTIRACEARTVNHGRLSRNEDVE